MPYIPPEHQKYDLLSWCKEHGGEVFEYPVLLDEISRKLDSKDSLMPYGYSSYEEYFSMLSHVREKYKNDVGLSDLLGQFYNEMQRLNQKEV